MISQRQIKKDRFYPSNLALNESHSLLESQIATRLTYLREAAQGKSDSKLKWLAGDLSKSYAWRSIDTEKAEPVLKKNGFECINELESINEGTDRIMAFPVRHRGIKERIKSALGDGQAIITGLTTAAAATGAQFSVALGLGMAHHLMSGAGHEALLSGLNMGLMTGQGLAAVVAGGIAALGLVGGALNLGDGDPAGGFLYGAAGVGAGGLALAAAHGAFNTAASPDTFKGAIELGGLALQAGGLAVAGGLTTLFGFLAKDGIKSIRDELHKDTSGLVAQPRMDGVILRVENYQKPKAEEASVKVKTAPAMRLGMI